VSEQQKPQPGPMPPEIAERVRLGEAAFWSEEDQQWVIGDDAGDILDDDDGPPDDDDDDGGQE
jgi:hypothetical protein